MLVPLQSVKKRVTNILRKMVCFAHVIISELRFIVLFGAFGEHGNGCWSESQENEMVVRISIIAAFYFH